MSTGYQEMSNYGGRPVQLFDFNRGSLHWRYARADQDITFPRDGQVYKALPGLADNGVQQLTTSEENDVSISVPSDSEIAQLYVSNTPTDRMYVTIWVYDLDEADDGRMYWKGTVAGKAVGDAGESRLNCQDLAVGFARKGLRLAWERDCPHTLYDSECRVDPALYEVVGTVVKAQGTRIQSAILQNFADNYFAGGFCMWEIAPGIYQRRGIESHGGSTVIIIGGVQSLVAGMTVKFYPGCGHTIQVCDSKFNNHLNFGGAPNLKGESPFSGNPVFR